MQPDIEQLERVAPTKDVNFIPLEDFGPNLTGIMQDGHEPTNTPGENLEGDAPAIAEKITNKIEAMLTESDFRGQFERQPGMGYDSHVTMIVRDTHNGEGNYIVSVPVTMSPDGNIEVNVGKDAALTYVSDEDFKNNGIHAPPLICTNPDGSPRLGNDGEVLLNQAGAYVSDLMQNSPDVAEFMRGEREGSTFYMTVKQPEPNDMNITKDGPQQTISGIIENPGDRLDPNGFAAAIVQEVRKHESLEGEGPELARQIVDGITDGITNEIGRAPNGSYQIQFIAQDPTGASSKLFMGAEITVNEGKITGIENIQADGQKDVLMELGVAQYGEISQEIIEKLQEEALADVAANNQDLMGAALLDQGYDISDLVTAKFNDAAGGFTIVSVEPALDASAQEPATAVPAAAPPPGMSGP